MHSDLAERCSAARSDIDVPAFPWDAIRAGGQRAAPSVFRGRTPAAIGVAVFSLAAIAAAAKIAVQSHIGFTPHGGMVIASSAKAGSHAIHGDAEIGEAAKHVDFAVILPAGLPEGARPVQLYTAGTSILAITYDIPGHHRLWIFLANPDAMGSAQTAGLKHHKNNRMISMRWRTGNEEVIAVSDGLSARDLNLIKDAMNAQTTH